MTIKRSTWDKYSKRLSKINAEAARLIQEWIDRNGLDDIDALTDYAYGIATKYGEAAGALSAELYDAIAELSRANTEPAEIAPTPSYGEMAKTVRGVMKQSSNAAMIAAAVGRQVKRCGAQTTLKNAGRDRAEAAWIAIGDTCPYCLMIAAEGWKRVSPTSQADHIHGNCDCTYSVRFNKDTQIGGYDPGRYEKMFDNAEGDTTEEKLNSMRRDAYAKNKDEINAQKRDAYALRKEESEAEEIEA